MIRFVRLIVGTGIFVLCSVWVIQNGLEMTAGMDSITQRFAPGRPVEIRLGRYDSARSIFVRTDSEGAPACEVDGPDVTLEERSGHDLTAGGATWRRIYAIDSFRNAGTTYVVTCHAERNAEFAFGRDRHMDAMLLFILPVAAVLLSAVGLTHLRARSQGEDIAAPDGDAAGEEAKT